MEGFEVTARQGPSDAVNYPVGRIFRVPERNLLPNWQNGLEKNETNCKVLKGFWRFQKPCRAPEACLPQ